MQYSPVSKEIKAAIREKIGSDSIISASDALADYAGDASTLKFTPELVVVAKSVSDIQALMELAGNSIELQKSIKKLFDPNMILNPGKIFLEP